MPENCVFCKIISGEIPSHKIYEDGEVLAFLDASPVFRGHTLLVPKEHFENIFDIPEEVLGRLAKRAKRIVVAMKEGLGTDGVNLLHASGSVAQQSVFHFHLHIVPRFENDGLDMFPEKKYTERSFEATAEKIRGALPSS